MICTQHIPKTWHLIMYKILIALSFLIIPYQVDARVFPKEGSRLHYRIIGFCFDSIQQAKKYVIDIAAGNYNTDDSFKRNIIISNATNENKIITEVPYFGMQYTWRITSIAQHSKRVKSELHHFSTTFIQDLDTN